MPTQLETYYLREKYQGFSKHKLEWSVLISLSTGLVTAPFELLKARAQLLQEGRVVHGFSLYRGVPTSRMAYEIFDSGAGLRGLWLGLDNIIAKNLSFGAIRCYLWCKIYNYFNSDARSKLYITIFSYNIFDLYFKEPGIGLQIPLRTFLLD